MVPITKEEKNLLKQKYPDLCIARTMRQDSKRKHYFCEERPGALSYLNRIRMRNVAFDSEWPNGVKPERQDDGRQRKPWQNQNSRKGDRR